MRVPSCYDLETAINCYKLQCLKQFNAQLSVFDDKTNENSNDKIDNAQLSINWCAFVWMSKQTV